LNNHGRKRSNSTSIGAAGGEGAGCVAGGSPPGSRASVAGWRLIAALPAEWLSGRDRGRSLRNRPPGERCRREFATEPRSLARRWPMLRREHVLPLAAQLSHDDRGGGKRAANARA